MKPKLILCLALVFSGGLFLSSAYGYQGPPVQLNPANLKTNYSFILVEAMNETNEADTYFRVYVLPKNGHKPDHFTGQLQVWDGDRMIVSTGVAVATSKGLRRAPHNPYIPKPLYDKTVEFEFSVASKYVATSEFYLSEGLPEFEADDYLINLKDFTDEK
jgi:hypothetical protein